eukprot:CAMPEP_0172063764 /NCGR_PEP_ID=MMETSP1043-20130122/9747_1 /TAXON_ID=464988 /ORGANISM="Hemiselmis andersenii, Strain CCMP441" /LENGTH=296 /DNA_ID=CAMNT_0012723769 /DNA_START=144 /DNA_END=1033 /DNA_ORIENTATION=+
MRRALEGAPLTKAGAAAGPRRIGCVIILRDHPGSLHVVGGRVVELLGGGEGLQARVLEGVLANCASSEEKSVHAQRNADVAGKLRALPVQELVEERQRGELLQRLQHLLHLRGGGIVALHHRNGDEIAVGTHRVAHWEGICVVARQRGHLHALRVRRVVGHDLPRSHVKVLVVPVDLKVVAQSELLDGAQRPVDLASDVILRHRVDVVEAIERVSVWDDDVHLAPRGKPHAAVTFLADAQSGWEGATGDGGRHALWHLSSIDSHPSHPCPRPRAPALAAATSLSRPINAGVLGSGG